MRIARKPQTITDANSAGTILIFSPPSCPSRQLLGACLTPKFRASARECQKPPKQTRPPTYAPPKRFHLRHLERSIARRVALRKIGIPLRIGGPGPSRCAILAIRPEAREGPTASPDSEQFRSGPRDLPAAVRQAERTIRSPSVTGGHS